jgi:hypothetical protein
MLEALLDPAFVEVGTSGHRYTRSEVISALRAPGAAADHQADGFECVQLARDLAQLRYRSIDRRQGVERQALRSSLWRNNAAGCSCCFIKAPCSPRMSHPECLSSRRFPCLQTPVPHA